MHILAGLGCTLCFFGDHLEPCEQKAAWVHQSFENSSNCLTWD
jgi:hypothetical protein